MPSLTQRLFQHKADTTNASIALLDKAKDEERDLTDEERTALDANETRLEEIDADYQRAVRAEEWQRGLKPPQDPNEGMAQIGGERDPPPADPPIPNPFRSLGEFLHAVVRSDMPGAAVDPRLLEIQAAASGGSVAVPSDGGHLVQTDFSTALLARAIEAAVLAPLCTPLEIGAGSNAVELPYIDETSRATGSRFGGVQVYRRAEADAVTATKPKFGKKRLELEELMGIAYATEELLLDATAMESIFTTAFSSEFSFKLDDEILRGSGAGECLGIIATANSALVSQAKETGQEADTIYLENLSKMWSDMPARNKARSIWLINSEVTPELDKLFVTAGTGALEPRIVTYNEAGVMRIKGRPVIEIEQASALGDLGDIVLVDMAEYLLARKGGIQADQSMHVRFLNNERTFRWIMRVNGMPAWRTTLTPYKAASGKVVSPYVALAART